MSLKDIRLSTAQARQESVKSLPSRVYGAMIWGNGVWSQTKYNRKQLIEQAYERNPAFYAAVNIIASTVASIPVYVEYKTEGKVHTTSSHPYLAMLDRNISRQDMIERMVKYLLTTGDGYAQIVKGNGNRPLGCIVMPSQNTYNIEGDYRRPIRGYKYIETREEEFSEEEVVHIWIPSLSKYFQGMPPSVPLQEYIDLNNAAITWNKNIALAGGIPPVIAKMDGGTKEDAQKLRQSWAEQSGANNSHVLKVVSENLTLEKMNMTPHDAEWERAVLQAMRVIFMTLGVSSSIMNDAANKTYNNVHDSRKALYQEGAIPLAHKVYAAFNNKLSRYYADGARVVPDVDAIDVIQEDKRMQSDRLVKLKESGIITANEVRAELRYPLSPDPKANELVTSAVANQLATGKRPNTEPSPQTPPDPTL